MTALRWIIVMSTSRGEWDAFRLLMRQGIEAYYPFDMKTVRQGHHHQGMAKPIYPGYLFAAPRPGQSIESIEKTIGVSRVLRQGVDLVFLSQSQLDTIKRSCSGFLRASLPYREEVYVPTIGDVITIPHGAFMGVPAIINTIDKSGNIGASIGNLEVTFHLSALRTSERGRRNALPDNNHHKRFKHGTTYA